MCGFLAGSPRSRISWTPNTSVGSMDITDSYMQNLGYPGDSIFDVGGDLSTIQFTPSFDLDNYGSSFQDPSYPVDFFEVFGDPNLNSTETQPPDLDNKFLGFGAPIHKSAVLDGSGQTWPRMSAELNGMFCVAEDVFEGDGMGRPLELTCYRRNLFQISGNITLSRTITHVQIDQSTHAPIDELVATLSATESIDGNVADIITVPWKSGAANGMASEEKGGAAAADIPINLSSNQETDSMIVTVPIAWGRLQFKNATANNGRRKGLQQHYKVQISLMARLEGDGQLIQLAEIQSNPIVVRGRSPKNFDSSKDVPLSDRISHGDKKDSRAKTATLPNISTPWIEPALSQAHGYYSQTSFQLPPETSPWTNISPISEHRSKKIASSSTISSTPSTTLRQPGPPSSTSSWPEATFSSYSNKPAIPLTFSDDDSTPEVTPEVTPDPAKLSEKSVTKVVSPTDLDDDNLYEYFPLSLDDWMPPVDAIYRPHVVHHLRVQPESKAPAGRQRPKRYFSGAE